MALNRLVRLAVAGLAVVGAAQVACASSGEEEEVKAWEELAIDLPASPRARDLLGFYVSAGTENRFFIDPASISVGGDGVVRYTLVVTTPAGARNVSYEGMRCDTRERRLYAFGRQDGTWSRARVSRWEPVRESSGNRYHAALFQEYFCPGGVIVRNAQEVRDALRHGGQVSIGGA